MSIRPETWPITFIMFFYVMENVKFRLSDLHEKVTVKVNVTAYLLRTFHALAIIVLHIDFQIKTF